jgi:general stress protein 26
MTPEPTPALDRRFSAPEATATPWADVERVLDAAELFWLTTVRKDGRPHATPLIGVRVSGAMHFTTGLDEQKARNLEGNREVVLVTGVNTWASGLDVVVEGTAERVTEHAELTAVAAAIEAKYGDAWHFDVGDGVLQGQGEHGAGVFRIDARKVLAFAKDPHAHTSFRFDS